MTGIRLRVDLAVAAVIALATLSGCLDAQAVQGEATRGPPPFVAIRSIVHRSAGTGEPSLGVEPDGTLWTTGVVPFNPLGSGRRLVALRSGDDGRTWQLVDPGIRTADADPDLAVSRDGTIWVDSLYVACTSAASSQDSGATWMVNPLACMPLAGDRQYVVPTQDGTAFAFSHERPFFRHMVARTEDYGTTWIPLGPVEPLTEMPNNASQWASGGFWNPLTGSVFLSYIRLDSDVLDVLGVRAAWFPTISVSRDNGATWEVVMLPSAGGQPISFLQLVSGAVDEAGNVYLTWAESLDGGTAVYLVGSRDDGRTWSAPIRVDQGGKSTVFPAIAAGRSGNVAIAYYEADRPGHPSALAADSQWNVTLAWTKNAFSRNPRFEHAQLNDEAVKTGPICTQGAVCESDRDLLDYFALEALPDRRVASVWASTQDIPGRVVNVYASTRAPILA